MVANNSKNIRFARVNCVDQVELCNTYSTPMYPTIRLFQGLDHETIYDGAREPSEYVLTPPKHVHCSDHVKSFHRVSRIGPYFRRTA
jgi:hypothetical protein